MPTWEICYLDREMQRHVVPMVSDEKPSLDIAAAIIQTRVTGRHCSDADLLKFSMDPIVFLLARGIVITTINSH